VCVLFSFGSLVATLLDREAEQKFFDNRYDVPESVRPIYNRQPILASSGDGTLSNLSD
jgi:hypothetical protein